MPYRVAVEDIEPGHWVAWVLDLLGCFSSGTTEKAALDAVPTAIRRYVDWLKTQGHLNVRLEAPIATRVVEVCRARRISAEYLANACFEDDYRALSHAEVGEGLRLLGFMRRDLLRLVEYLSEEALDVQEPQLGERTARQLLMHVAGAEWWYVTRLEVSSNASDMPAELLPRLAWVRRQSSSLLARWAGDGRAFEHSSEVWTARKLLRRTLWHERDHSAQLARIVSIESDRESLRGGRSSRGCKA